MLPLRAMVTYKRAGKNTSYCVRVDKIKGIDCLASRLYGIKNIATFGHADCTSEARIMYVLFYLVNKLYYLFQC